MNGIPKVRIVCTFEVAFGVAVGVWMRLVPLVAMLPRVGVLVVLRVLVIRCVVLVLLSGLRSLLVLVAPVNPPPSERKIKHGAEERVKMTRLRLTIAKRLKEAQENAAMLTTFNEVDMSKVINMRVRQMV